MKYKIIGISLIFISLIGFIYLKISMSSEYYNHQKELEAIFINGEPNKTNYIGYVEIDSIDLKRGIVKGIDDVILNNDDVGMIRNNNIILAGHAVDNVFGKLNNISTFDKIKIYLYNQIYSYTVYKKVVVEKDNIDYLNDDLVLITCTNDDKRLLVLAKKDI